MTEPVTISQYPQGFLAVLTSQPFVFGVLISAVVFLFFVVVDPGVTWLINAVTHGERRPLIKSKLYMTIAMSFAVLALICMVGVLSVDTVKASNNFDTVSNAYGITISDNSDDITRVLRPGARSGSTPVTFTDGDGKPQMGVLVRKGNKVTVYNNAANRLTPLKRAAR